MLTSFFLLFLAVSKNAENSQVYCNIFDNHSGSQQWKAVEFAERDSNTKSVPSKSNRETWKSATRKQVDYSSVAPTRAQRYCESNGLVISCNVSCTNHVTSPHCPWHLDIQLSWSDFPYFEKVLMYELLHTPTIKSPYYVARVCSMPNIQCKATSMGELEQMLLAEYSQYLLKMLQDKDFIGVDKNVLPDYGVPMNSPLLTQPPLWFDNGYILGLQFTF